MKLNLIFAVITVAASLVSSAPLSEKRALSCHSGAKFTQYWIPKEGDQDMANNGKSVTLSGSKTEPLITSSGATIALVSKTTYKKFEMEGTGLLSSGVMVNLGSNKNVFIKVDRSSTLGTVLYIEELDGLSLPNGRTHNGCVRVDDAGWGLDRCQIDFFVLQFSAYRELSSSLPSTVTATEKSCNIQNYVTGAVKRWVVL
ncbi:hypothetical protein K501DRAFT_295389 [Backusella circina FSU 941]|nr:hypothetical protein K501DRAFT_295389 [Backusella circina FSU 941]